MKDKKFNIWTVGTLATIAIMVVLFLGIQSFLQAQDATFDQFNKRQLALAKQVSGSIELYFETIASSLRRIATNEGILGLEEAVLRPALQQSFDEIEYLGSNGTAIIDVNGTVVYAIDAPQLEGLDFSWRKYFQKAKTRRPGSGYIVEFIEFKGADLGKRGLILALPFFTEDSEFAGVLVATLRVDVLAEKFVGPLNATEGEHAFLIDDESNNLWVHDLIIYGRNIKEDIENNHVLQEIINESKTGNSGTAEYSFYGFDYSTGQYMAEKQELVVAYSPITFGDDVWTFGVSTSKDNVLNLINSAFISQLFLLGVIVLIVISALAYVLSFTQSYNRSLEKEVGKKTVELEKSKGKIEKYSKTLEMKVMQRTKELDKKIEQLEDAKLAMLNVLEDREEARKELEKSFEKLKEIDKLKAQFLTMTSHELRTPITPAIVQAQMILDKSLGRTTKQQKTSAEIILRNMKRLNTLIGDILDISKIRAAQLKLLTKKAQLAECINKTVQELTPVAKQKNITLETSMGPLPEISFDWQRISQVLTNLIINAIKFTPKKGKITIAAAKESNVIRVKVIDTGIGIAPRHIKKIFEPFFQVALAYTRNEKGTGLGLPICRGIIRQHGGRISVESGVGKGSVFSFTLPIKAAKKPKAGKKSSKALK